MNGGGEQPDLQTLWLYSNRLSGPIPTQVGQSLSFLIQLLLLELLELLLVVRSCARVMNNALLWLNVTLWRRETNLTVCIT